MVNVSLTGLAQELNQRENSGIPIRVGLIGCGEMGTDIVVCMSRMKGVKLSAIVERNPKNAFEALKLVNPDDQTKAVESADKLNAIIENNETVVTNNPQAVFESGLIDVVIDATGVPDAGANLGLQAINHGKHLVMMNVEADVTIGPILNHYANKAGVVYSLGAGDEPSACMELIEFASSLGYNIIAAGKGKNNPLDFDAVPEDYEEEARNRNMNPRMLVEFVDGSKTMVEMAAISNATGLIPDRPGMHGPKAGLDELSNILIPVSRGGILSAPGRVDFSIGKGVAPGVFVVIEADHPRLHERMRDLKMGEGPFFTLYRPFHMTSLEVPLTCARVVLKKQPDMVPLKRLSAEVCAVAKTDLATGDSLGLIGEHTYRAKTYQANEAKAQKAVPCGLLNGAKVKAAIKKGSLITYENTQIDHTTHIAKLRKEQDSLT